MIHVNTDKTEFQFARKKHINVKIATFMRHLFGNITSKVVFNDHNYSGIIGRKVERSVIEGVFGRKSFRTSEVCMSDTTGKTGFGENCEI